VAARVSGTAASAHSTRPEESSTRRKCARGGGVGVGTGASRVSETRASGPESQRVREAGSS